MLVDVEGKVVSQVAVGASVVLELAGATRKVKDHYAQ
jgi:hypothetical protein